MENRLADLGCATLIVKVFRGLAEGVFGGGYCSISGEDESLFYWFVGTDDWASRPTVVWSNGGPGSSSFWGFFTENGPYVVEDADTPKLSVRETAWNKDVNYLMIEHPLSVTLSFAKDAANIPANVEAGTVQYYQALLNIIAKHPEIKNNPLVLAGESYAGTVQEVMEGEDGLRMIIVSGLNDAKDCNFLGTGAWLELLEGTSAARFEEADTVPWVETNAPVPYLGSVQDGATTAGGIDKEGGKLAWVKVMNAGHLAVGDQPLLLGKLRELGEF